MKETLALIFSIVAVVTSGIIAFSFYFDIENVSVPLGMLTAIITILVSWQIFQIVETKEKYAKIDKMELALKSYIKTLSTALDGYQDDVVMIRNYRSPLSLGLKAKI